MRRLLVVEPRGGLGNRLRVMLTGEVAARASGRELRVVWRRVRRRLTCSLGDLLEEGPAELEDVPAGAVVVEHRSSDADLLPVPAGGPAPVVAARTCYPLLSGEDAGGRRYGRGGGERGQQDRLDAITRDACERLGGLPWRPRREVLGMVGEVDVCGRVGVHMRVSGGNVLSRTLSPLDAFLEVLGREDGPFFVAADDDGWSRAALAGAGGRAVGLPVPPGARRDGRDAPSVRFGLAEMLLLSGCRRVLGSRRSSFGTLAAALGGVSFEPVPTTERGRRP